MAIGPRARTLLLVAAGLAVVVLVVVLVEAQGYVPGVEASAPGAR